MKKLALGLALLLIFTMAFGLNNAYASNTTTTATTAQTQTVQDTGISAKAMGASIAVGLGALGAALGMGFAISKAAEGISKQPEAEGKIRTTLMLGLVFIETVVIYALIVAILVIFVL